MKWHRLAVVGLALSVACGGSSIRRGSGADDDSAGRSGASAGGSSAYGGTGGTVSGGVPIGGTGALTGGSPAGGVVGGGKGGSGFVDGGPIDPPEPPRCGGIECASPMACCLANSRCFDPLREPKACPVPETNPDHEDQRPCASNAHCGTTEYCFQEGVLCQGTGFCQSRLNCPSSSEPVCACDGNTYANVQTACHAGMNVGGFWRGTCGDTIDANGGEDEPRWVTVCGNDSHCRSGERCCSLTRICYPVSDPGRCQVPPDGTRYPCTANDQCAPEEYCAGEGCNGPGGCLRRNNEACGVRFRPVCGCDGVTYTSAACAREGGTRVESSGECGVGGAASE